MIDHGDPYVFPAGVAEQEHVLVQVAARPASEARAPDPGVRRQGPSATRRRRRASTTSAAAGRHRARSATAPARSRAPSARSAADSAAVWLGIAHALGATARSIGRTARDLEPEHRRDGVGLLLVGLAVVAAAAVWWQLPGAVMEVARTVVAGSVGKVGWLVPLVLVLIGWRNMRDPEHNGPAGRQVIGWAAARLRRARHRAHRQRQPAAGLGDTSALRTAGGAVGYVVSSLLLDLLRTPYVVVPAAACCSRSSACS